MTTYINELLQDMLVTEKDYSQLSESIFNYMTKNDDSKYEFIIDAIQMLILQQTNKFISYQECENMYLTIRGFQSIYEDDII